MDIKSHIAVKSIEKMPADGRAYKVSLSYPKEVLASHTLVEVASAFDTLCGGRMRVVPKTNRAVTDLKGRVTHYLLARKTQPSKSFSETASMTNIGNAKYLDQNNNQVWNVVTSGGLKRIVLNGEIGIDDINNGKQIETASAIPLRPHDFVSYLGKDGSVHYGHAYRKDSGGFIVIDPELASSFYTVGHDIIEAVSPFDVLGTQGCKILASAAPSQLEQTTDVKPMAPEEFETILDYLAKIYKANPAMIEELREKIGV